jgi:hypothetical protein
VGPRTYECPRWEGQSSTTPDTRTTAATSTRRKPMSGLREQRLQSATGTDQTGVQSSPIPFKLPQVLRSGQKCSDNDRLNTIDRCGRGSACHTNQVTCLLRVSFSSVIRGYGYTGYPKQCSHSSRQNVVPMAKPPVKNAEQQMLPARNGKDGQQKKPLHRNLMTLGQTQRDTKG